MGSAYSFFTDPLPFLKAQQRHHSTFTVDALKREYVHLLGPPARELIKMDGSLRAIAGHVRGNFEWDLIVRRVLLIVEHCNLIMYL